MKNLSDVLNESLKITNGIPYIPIDDYYIDSIKAGKRYFVQSMPVNNKVYAGWKYTIVGSSVEDSIYLYKQLGKYLLNIGVPFKMGTKKLINSSNKEQSVKLMTIYILNTTKVGLLLDDIKHFLKNYRTNARLTKSEHIYGPIYKRVDRDEYGNYVSA